MEFIDAVKEWLSSPTTRRVWRGDDMVLDYTKEGEDFLKCDMFIAVAGLFQDYHVEQLESGCSCGHFCEKCTGTAHQFHDLEDKI